MAALGRAAEGVLGEIRDVGTTRSCVIFKLMLSCLQSLFLVHRSIPLNPGLI